MSQFPIANFDWLGELPKLSSEAASRQLRGEIFSKLDKNDPASLRQAATRLMSSPRAEDTEMGIRLLNAATAQESAASRGIAERANAAWVAGGGIGRAAAAGNPTTTLPSSGVDFDPLSAEEVPTRPSPPAGPNPFGNAPTRGLQVPPDRMDQGPGALGPPSQDLVPPTAATPGPPPMRVASLGGGVALPPAAHGAPPPPMSPSEQMLGQVEGPQPAPGPQLAQAGPGSSFTQGMQVPIQPPAPPPQVAPQLPSPAGGPGEVEARRIAREAAAELAKMPRTQSNSPAARQLQEKLRYALGALKLDKDQIGYRLDAVQRAADKEPPISYQDYLNENKVVEQRYKSLDARYSDYHKDYKTSKELLNVIAPMTAIVENKNFASGRGTNLILGLKSGLLGLAKNAESLGVPASVIEGILPRNWQQITDTTKLQEAFEALSNQAIFAKLGTLGNQISEGDRNFIYAAFPNLSLSPEGNKILLKILTRVAQGAITNGQTAREYFDAQRTRGSVASMDKYVEAHAEKNHLFMDRNGNLTEEGKKYAKDVGLAPPDEAPPQPEAVPIPRPREAVPTDEAMDPEGNVWSMENGKPVRIIRPSRQ